MSRFLKRFLGVVFGVYATQTSADIALVATPLLVRPAFVAHSLPTHSPQRLGAVQAVSTRINADDVAHIDTRKQGDISAFGMPCDVDIHLEALPDAMIALHAFAPCKPHSVLNVSHDGLNYQSTLSMIGKTKLVFPAMKRDAVVYAAIDDDVFERSVQVDDVSYFARVALLGIRGEMPVMMASTLTRPLEIFHHPGLQVLSVDMRDVNERRTYRLTLRHQVTAQNCNRPIQAHLRKVLPGMSDEIQSLRLTGQDCGRIGEILELKNIVPDLKLAAN